MTPVLITPPTSQPVTLDEAKEHLRVDYDEEDTLIEALIAAAVGYLDGWRGVLGRAIMPQSWSVEVGGACRVTLPMPDVTSATMNGEALVVTATPSGPSVWAPSAGEIEFTCAMPAEQLPTVKAIILLLVAHWFANREAVSAGVTATELPMAVDMLVSSMRWRRV